MSHFCADWLNTCILNDEFYPYGIGYGMMNACKAFDGDHEGAQAVCRKQHVIEWTLICGAIADWLPSWALEQEKLDCMDLFV